MNPTKLESLLKGMELHLSDLQADVALLKKEKSTFASHENKKSRTSTDGCMAPSRCCGNCARFSNEDTGGNGWCGDHEGCPVGCGDFCERWEHRPIEPGEAVMWKQNSETETWKLGYYVRRERWGHCVRLASNHMFRAVIIEPFDTFNPYPNETN